jgi:hypothetical protein
MPRLVRASAVLATDSARGRFHETQCGNHPMAVWVRASSKPGAWQSRIAADGVSHAPRRIGDEWWERGLVIDYDCKLTVDNQAPSDVWHPIRAYLVGLQRDGFDLEAYLDRDECEARGLLDTVPPGKATELPDMLTGLAPAPSQGQTEDQNTILPNGAPGRPSSMHLITYYAGDERSHTSVAFLRALAWCSTDGIGDTRIADLRDPKKLAGELQLLLTGPSS